MSTQDTQQRVRAVPAQSQCDASVASGVREAVHADKELSEKVFDRSWVFVLVNHPSVDTGFLNRMRHLTRCTHCPPSLFLYVQQWTQ